MKNSNYKNTQKYKRYKFQCEGCVIVSHSKVAFSVEDVSERGLKVVLQDLIDMQQNYAIRICINSSKNIEIIARPVWDNEKNHLGFEVLNNDPQWEKFIQQVESGYFKMADCAA